MTFPCDSSMIPDTVEMYLKRINQVIRKNVYSLVLCAIVGLVTVAVVCTMAGLGWASVKSYRLHTQTTLLNFSDKAKNKNKEPNRDDVTYVTETPDGIDAELPDAPERTRIASSLKRIKSQYAAYNRAIAQHDRNKGREPEDLMDERIISAEHDDYTSKDLRGTKAPVYRPKQHQEYGDTTTVAERANDTRESRSQDPAARAAAATGMLM